MDTLKIDEKRQYHESWYSDSSPLKEEYVCPPDIDRRRKIMLKALTKDVTTIITNFTDLITSISLLVCLEMFDHAEHLLKEGLGRIEESSVGINMPIFVKQIIDLAEMGDKYVRIIRWINRMIDDRYVLNVAEKIVGLVTAEEFHLLFPTVVSRLINCKISVLNSDVFYGVSPSSVDINNSLSNACERRDTRRMREIIRRMNQLKIDVNIGIFTTYGSIYRDGKGTRMLSDVWRLLDKRGKIKLSYASAANPHIPRSLRGIFAEDISYPF